MVVSRSTGNCGCMPNNDLVGYPTAPTTAVHIDSPSALIACAPFLLGFVPEDSIVVVFTDNQRVALTVRFDLIAEPSQNQIADIRQVFVSTMDQISANRVSVDAAIVIVFTSDAAQCPGAQLLTALHDVFVQSGLGDCQWFASDHNRLWCYVSTCPHCPGGGHPLDEQQKHSAQFDMVSRGFGYVASRQVLERSVGPDAELLIGDVEMRRALGSFTAENLNTRLTIEDELVAACGTTLDAERIRRQGALWAIALRDSRVREPVMYRLLTAAPHRQRQVLAGARTWFTALTRSLSDDWVAPTAATLAALAWQEGDGAFARIAAGRALAADPSNTLANLIDTAAGSGMPPYSWRQVLIHFGLEALRQGDPEPSGGTTEFGM